MAYTQSRYCAGFCRRAVVLCLRRKRVGVIQCLYEATMKAESARLLATMTAIKDHPLYRGREAMADKLAASGCTVAQIDSTLQVARATLPTAEEREADREAARRAQADSIWDRASGSARA